MVAVATTVCFSAGIARADNTADEAELEFELGAERYQAADFRGALQHFLASNRLVPNNNVVYNVARSYEALKQYPDAYRYYSQASENEKDPAAKARIEQALTKLSASVGVVRVETTPPDANIYLERKDLGSRGSSPRSFGLAPAKYKVIVEKDGYEPAEEIVEAKVGSSSVLRITLKQILGTLKVGSSPTKASVRIDKESAAVACVTPCTLSIPPGQHVVLLSLPGAQVSSTLVDIRASETTAIEPSLVTVTGSLVVNADVRDAMVEVDGKTQGFTPALFNIAVGRHKLRVLSEGYRPIEKTIDVEANQQLKFDLQLEQVEQVSAASRLTESVQDAPSSVTIVTKEELRAFGYPTIAEALRGVRGIYLSDDRSYATVGFRGFSRLGDYGNRVLLLVDGHPVNNNFTGASFVAFDGRVDIEDVERIEVVRGAGSVLYGTGAFFGVINVVTRGKDQRNHAELGTSTVSDRVFRGRASGYVRAGQDAGIWASASVARSFGRDFAFPDYVKDTSPDVAGNARGVDGFDAGTVSARGWFKDLTVSFMVHQRKKIEPSGRFSVVFGDPRNTIEDTRGFVEGKYEPTIGKNLVLSSRVYGNFYGFVGFRAFPEALVGLAKTTFEGKWIGAEQRIIWTPIPQLRATVGAELQRHFQVRQRSSSEGTGTVLDRDDPYTVIAGYGNVDVTLGPVKLTGGARYDSYSNSSGAISPRIAAVVRPTETTTIKVIGGKAFRAPSAYELYFSAGTVRSSTELRPENIYTGELELSQKLTPSVTATLSGYGSQADDLVTLTTLGTGPFAAYANSPSPIRTFGGEVELRREFRQGLMIAASYAFQRANYVDPGGLREVPNSPQHVASLKGVTPIVGKTLRLATRLSFEGPRYDRFDKATDPDQGTTPAGFLWDIVLSGETDKGTLTYQLGIYNVADWQYSVPVSAEFRQSSLLQSGRTLMASLGVNLP